MKNKSNTNLIEKILKSIGILFLSFIILIFLEILIDFDNTLSQLFHYISFFALLIIAISKIWNNTKKKNIKFIIFFAIFIGNMTYYNFLSMRIEPLFHLNAKYDISFFDMKIIDTYTSAPEGFLGGGSPRGAIIECNGVEVYVYYGRNGWIDDYEGQSETKNNDTNILRNFHSLLEKYSDKYKIISDSGLGEYGYIIFLQTDDYLTIKNVIYELDNFIVDYKDKFNVHPIYSMYIIKEEKLYNKISSINTRKLKLGGQTSASDLFEVLNMRASNLSSFELNDYSRFSNYGNINENIIKKYKNLLFYYSASPNKFIGDFSRNLVIWGIE